MTESKALFADFYHATMAYGLWKLGLHEEQACFCLFFRKAPFNGGYAVAAGLADAVDWLRDFRFDDSDLEYLAEVPGADGEPIIREKGFLSYLKEMSFRCDIDAVPEGTFVFPYEPILRVTGPKIQAQYIEGALLNIVGHQTLLATKASRVRQAAGQRPVLEFGLRRAHGPDGAVSGSRAAYIGGCDRTSNMLAGKKYGIPVAGTHAHDWVMFFDTEIEAFRAYAQTLPNNCVFLVDTYDTLEGVRNAVIVGKELRDMGFEMIGVRLDSGDLAWYSIEARKILDAEGFPGAKIVASNSLDEHLIESLERQGAKIAVLGVGERIAVADGCPAHGCVYKLTAVRKRPEDLWTPRIKVSENVGKTTIPGHIDAARFRRDGVFAGDVIFDRALGFGNPCAIVDPLDPTRTKRLEGTPEPLLAPVFRNGELVAMPEGPEAARARCLAQAGAFYPGILRFENPHQYPVGLEKNLHDRRTQMVLSARKNERAE